MPDEYRAVLKKDEGVFTPGQMKALANNQNNTSNQPPNIKVNIVINTGNPVSATPKVDFDMQGMVISMVIDGMDRNVGGIRRAFGG